MLQKLGKDQIRHTVSHWVGDRAVRRLSVSRTMKKYVLKNEVLFRCVCMCVCVCVYVPEYNV